MDDADDFVKDATRLLLRIIGGLTAVIGWSIVGVRFIISNEPPSAQTVMFLSTATAGFVGEPVIRAFLEGRRGPPGGPGSAA